MTGVLFAAGPGLWETYRDPLGRALAEAGVDARLAPDLPPEETDYIVYAPASELQDFRPYTRARAVLNLWAGVEGVVGNPTLTQPLARMVDPGMTQGMVEYVVGHVLRRHLGLDTYIHGLGGEWRRDVPPLAGGRRVAVLGLGALGAACATALAQLGFDVTGWSRRKKDLPGVRSFGAEALDEVLGGAEILVLLVPRTAETEGLMDRRRLALLPAGAAVVNPGRGALIDDAALIEALDAGRIGHATLDVFRQEPLPPEHPFWTHPRVTVTPHIASETRPETASQVIAENIRRGEAGEPFLHLVDRAAGY